MSRSARRGVGGGMPRQLFKSTTCRAPMRAEQRGGRSNRPSSWSAAIRRPSDEAAMTAKVRARQRPDQMTRLASSRRMGSGAAVHAAGRMSEVRRPDRVRGAPAWRENAARFARPARTACRSPAARMPETRRRAKIAYSLRRAVDGREQRAPRPARRQQSPPRLAMTEQESAASAPLRMSPRRAMVRAVEQEIGDAPGRSHDHERPACREEPPHWRSPARRERRRRTSRLRARASPAGSRPSADPPATASR